MRVRWLALPVVAAALGAGCGAATDAPESGSNSATTKVVRASVAVLREGALAELVRAAGADDEPKMWAALTQASRKQLGPSLAEFRSVNAGGLRATLAPFARSPYRVILNQVITLDMALIAIEGTQAVDGKREYAAYAVPLRREHGKWRMQVDPLLTIEAVRPIPLGQVRERTQLFAELAAPRAIDDAALWFDGTAFSARGYFSTDRKRMSVWGEAPQPLKKGHHTVVAFARAGPDAAATAWTFTVTKAGHVPTHFDGILPP
jgi:hypothetical protein